MNINSIKPLISTSFVDNFFNSMTPIQKKTMAIALGILSVIGLIAYGLYRHINSRLTKITNDKSSRAEAAIQKNPSAPKGEEVKQVDNSQLPSIEIHLKSSKNGHSLTLDVTENETVGEVKEKLAKKLNLHKLTREVVPTIKNSSQLDEKQMKEALWRAAINTAKDIVKPADIRLIFAGQMLKNETTLREINISMRRDSIFLFLY